MPEDLSFRLASQSKLLELFHKLGEIGKSDTGGICRLAASREDGQARDFLCNWLNDHNFSVLVDEIGNIFGVLDLEKGPKGRHFFCGSHLDSQPEAGKFDGALGVACACIAGLHLHKRIKSDGLDPAFRYFVVSCWTGEEGARFQPSMVGSSVYSGAITTKDALAFTDSDGVDLQSALQEIGYCGSDTIPSADHYLELHIEQGVELENAQIPIAIVTACWGAKKIRLQLNGVADHTGPTPMDVRRNALLTASWVIIQVEELASRSDATLFSSVGRIEVHPNSPNTIADHVQLWIEFRSPNETALDVAEQGLVQALANIEDRTGCTWAFMDVETRKVVSFDKDAISIVEAGWAEASIPHLHLTTIAGHDAIRLQSVCPTTLLFVPSKDGITHSPAEYTSDEDVCAGFEGMVGALSRLMAKPASGQSTRRMSQ